jgi:DNA-binding transcriptional ArsR family regulator
VSVRDTTGVSGLVRVLARLAEGSPSSVAELARDEDLSRSSAFALARRLEAAQLVARDLEGKLIAGPQAIALAYSRFGLAQLYGPADAVLRWLRDHGAATAKLTCDGDRTTLLSFCADGAKPAGATFSHAICDENGAAARLEVACRSDISALDRAEIEQLALRAKATLEHHLREPSDAPLPVGRGGEQRA